MTDCKRCGRPMVEPVSLDGRSLPYCPSCILLLEPEPVSTDERNAVTRAIAGMPLTDEQYDLCEAVAAKILAKNFGETMERRIFKTPVPETPGTWQIEVPGKSIRVLSVVDGECWYEFSYQELMERQQKIEFLTAWTGEPFDLPVDFKFVGTTRTGPLVVHLYWRLVGE